MKDLNTLLKIKNFMKWCKANKIKSFKGEGIEFELSDLGFIEQDIMLDQMETAQETSEEANLEEKQQNEDDDNSMLFWSSD